MKDRFELLRVSSIDLSLMTGMESSTDKPTICILSERSMLDTRRSLKRGQRTAPKQRNALRESLTKMPKSKLIHFLPPQSLQSARYDDLESTESLYCGLQGSLSQCNTRLSSSRWRKSGFEFVELSLANCLNDARLEAQSSWCRMSPPNFLWFFGFVHMMTSFKPLNFFSVVLQGMLWQNRTRIAFLCSRDILPSFKYLFIP